MWRVLPPVLRYVYPRVQMCVDMGFQSFTTVSFLSSVSCLTLRVSACADVRGHGVPELHHGILPLLCLLFNLTCIRVCRCAWTWGSRASPPSPSSPPPSSASETPIVRQAFSNITDFFPSRIRTVSIPDPYQRIKVFYIFKPQKNGF
jgi:hypothetical protein